MHHMKHYIVPVLIFLIFFLLVLQIVISGIIINKLHQTNKSISHIEEQLKDWGVYEGN